MGGGGGGAKGSDSVEGTTDCFGWTSVVDGLAESVGAPPSGGAGAEAPPSPSIYLE